MYRASCEATGLVFSAVFHSKGCGWMAIWVSSNSDHRRSTWHRDKNRLIGQYTTGMATQHYGGVQFQLSLELFNVYFHLQTCCRKLNDQLRCFTSQHPANRVERHAMSPGTDAVSDLQDVAQRGKWSIRNHDRRIWIKK